METRASILEHVIAPKKGGLGEEFARFLLSLDFPAADRRRYGELADKAQTGTLSGQEKAELDEYLNVNDFLAIVQAKARSSLSNGTKK